MLAHGFSIDMMVELVNAGLASASTERRWPLADGGYASADYGSGATGAGVAPSSDPR
jgi:hypothetical protein